MNDYQNQNRKPSLWSGLRSGVKTTIIAVPLVLIGLVALYYLSPDVKQFVSKTVGTINAETDLVDNKIHAEMIPFPSNKPTTKPMPKVNLIGYGWNGASGWNAANGGPVTLEGSLMEKAGVNLGLTRQDNFDKIREAQLLALKEFHQGNNFPVNGAIGTWVMGDGAAYYISTTQQIIDKLYGEGKYHVKVAAAAGISYGEDKMIVPAAWKQDPQKLRGAVIATVIGDGNWVVAVNYASQLGIPINPDPTTWDPNALNFVQAEDADYIKAAQMFVKSQKGGVEYEFKLMKDGKKTNETVKKKIDGVSTWFPGDKIAFDGVGDGFVSIISTREYNNQMPNTLIIIDEWAQKNTSVLENMLIAVYTATNQIKLYDEWLRYATECNAKTYQFQTGDYWYKAFKSYTQTTPLGLETSIGGTRVFNYADVEQYYGLNGTPSRYEAVYTQVANYLDELDPMGYKDVVKRTIPYSEAINLDYVRAIKDRMTSQQGQSYQTDYSANTGQVVAQGNFAITFKTGSAQIDDKGMKTVESIYRSINFSEDLKVNIVGYTDNVGDDAMNLELSRKRAESVKNALIRMGLPSQRFDYVDGAGEAKPVASNDTESGRQQNRRVEITMLK